MQVRYHLDSLKSGDTVFVECTQEQIDKLQKILAKKKASIKSITDLKNNHKYLAIQKN
jgi:hypothetical protein